MPSTLLPCEIIEPATSANAAIIWLHGLGANGFDFVPVAEQLNLPDTIAMRFIFPHAPEMPVTVNNGYVMPSWYDILSFNWDNNSGKRMINSDQFTASVLAIRALIEREMAHGIASERIFLAGFSQGGAIAYEAALGYDKPLGGLLALSTYLQFDLTTDIHAANKQLPVCILHGSLDTVVLEMMGQRAFSVLQMLGLSPGYKNYPMGHEVCNAEIADISTWLKQKLS
jgi:phospholipase/carboxylesterase